DAIVAGEQPARPAAASTPPRRAERRGDPAAERRPPTEPAPRAVLPWTLAAVFGGLLLISVIVIIVVATADRNGDGKGGFVGRGPGFRGDTTRPPLVPGTAPPQAGTTAPPKIFPLQDRGPITTRPSLPDRAVTTELPKKP